MAASENDCGDVAARYLDTYDDGLSADSYLEDQRHVGEIDVRAAACRRARARRSARPWLAWHACV